jgi:CubicO group peptidase (beta-lactamase class C family)
MFLAGAAPAAPGRLRKMARPFTSAAAGPGIAPRGPMAACACVALALLAPVAAAQGTAPAAPAPAAAPGPATYDAAIRWVQENRESFYFWSRYEDLLANPQEFPKPPSFYNPNVLVEGEQKGELPRVAKGRHTVSAAAWQQAVDWAFPRNTYALVVMRKGAIEYEKWAEGYWPGQMLPVRSFTKTLPSLLIGIAIGEGKIRSIDEPVATYLTEWKDDPRGRITIRQFLTMSSGLAGLDRTRDGGPRSPIVQLTDGADVWRAAFMFPKAAEPDTVFGLNQVDSQILGMVVERATGQPFADYLSQKLWRPLGAGTATLNVDAKGRARTLCCTRSALSDWLRVGQMIAQQGRFDGRQVVPAGYVEEMLKPSKLNPYKGLHIWLGWKPGTAEVKREGGGPLQMPTSKPYLVDDVAYLMGGGFMTTWIVPSQDLVILRWGFEPPKELGWDNSAVPNIILADLLRKR